MKKMIAVKATHCLKNTHCWWWARRRQCRVAMGGSNSIADPLTDNHKNFLSCSMSHFGNDTIDIQKKSRSLEVQWTGCYPTTWLSCASWSHPLTLSWNVDFWRLWLFLRASMSFLPTPLNRNSKLKICRDGERIISGGPIRWQGWRSHNIECC